MVKRNISSWINIVRLVDDPHEHPHWRKDQCNSTSMNLLQLIQLQEVGNFSISILQTFWCHFTLLQELVDSVWEHVLVDEEKPSFMSLLVLWLH